MKYNKIILLSISLVVFPSFSAEHNGAKKAADIKSSLMINPDYILKGIAENKKAKAAAQKEVYTKQQLKNRFVEQIKEIFNNLGDINSAFPHEKNKNTLRVATWNVHAFTDPSGKPNFDEMLKVIATINADIVILQEVIEDKKILAAFAALGYTFQSFAGGASKKSNFGNLILSKFNFAQAPEKHRFGPKGKKHKRSYVKVIIDLAKFGHKKNLVVYGTHLEVSNPKQRYEEIEQLVDLANKNDRGNNVLIAADFNETTNGKALKFLLDHGFTDIFKLSKLESPYFTHWTGKVLDNIYLKTSYKFNKQIVKDWDLWISGGYVYYTATSDHMPVIVDFKI